MAASLRIRSWNAFGVRRVGRRWLLVGVGGGLVALLAKIVLVPVLAALTSAPANTETDYAASTNSGPIFLALPVVSLAILTPVGEELLFRGVVTTALLRYRPIVATLGSAAIFALLHGINVVLPAAFIVGAITAELRRSGSIWPGALVHVINNLITVVAFALIPAFA